MQFTLKIIQTPDVYDVIEKAIREAAEQRLTDLAPVVRQLFKDQFLSSGSAGGQTWAPRKKQKPWPPLIASGRLLHSLADPSDPDHFENQDDLTLRIGTTVPYAAPLHLGGKFLEARPFITHQLAATAGLILLDPGTPLISTGKSIIEALTMHTGPISQGI